MSVSVCKSFRCTDLRRFISLCWKTVYTQKGIANIFAFGFTTFQIFLLKNRKCTEANRKTFRVRDFRRFISIIRNTVVGQTATIATECFWHFANQSCGRTQKILSNKMLDFEICFFLLLTILRARHMNQTKARAPRIPQTTLPYFFFPTQVRSQSTLPHPSPKQHKQPRRHRGRRDRRRIFMQPRHLFDEVHLSGRVRGEVVCW